MATGDELTDEVRAYSRLESYIHLQFQGKGTHPWTLGRLNGVPRGIYNRLRAGGRFVEKAAVNEIQYCVSTMLRHGGVSANRLFFRSNPVDLYSWNDNDRDLDFAHIAWVLSWFTLQWKLRVMAQEAILKNGQWQTATHPSSQSDICKRRFRNWRFSDIL